MWLMEVKGSYEPLVAISFKHPENHCRFCVHGTRHAEVVLFSCTVPDATPSSAVFGRRRYRDFWRLAFVDCIIHSPRRLHSFRRDGSRLLQVPRTAGILAATERRGRRGALLLHFSIFREHGWRAVELPPLVTETCINGLADFLLLASGAPIRVLSCRELGS